MDARTIASEILQSMRAWRRELHAHPELAYQEQRTADFVAAQLATLGINVHRGLGGTGVVGTLANGAGPAIALRADMDALPLQELNAFAHRSRNTGAMHACGHDGHVAMLLGAARQLAARPEFRGTVHFVFQPAEEGHGGGRAMVEDGLFRLFPCEAVYGMHNWPGLPAGRFAINRGPMMAALDTFEIVVHGRGSHAAMPEQGVDPFVAAAQIVLALQTIASRVLHPMDAAVVSVTQIHGGEAWNVIPDSVVLRGTARCFSPAVQDQVEESLRVICSSLAAASKATAAVKYERRYPPTINAPAQTDLAIAAARATAGAENVDVDVRPSMASEDFAFMLREKPGAYVWIGADGAQPSAPLHSPHYDFNDDILAQGAAYWVSLVSLALGVRP